jgi:hypothetical protein
MSDDAITICLTSCGRFDLLEKTISSLVSYWDGPAPYEFLIHEDSGQVPASLAIELNRFLQRHWKISAKWSYSHYKGQVNAIDTLYCQVQTPYIFHCEDDWEFYQEGFIKDSLSVLQHDKDIYTVWLRHPSDRNGHPVLNGQRLTKDNIRFQELAVGYRRIWHGFTWNPGLRRLSDYRMAGHFSDFCTWNNSNHAQSEEQFNAYYRRLGFKNATLCRGFVKHIGYLNSLKQYEIKSKREAS